jgi:hypothetical protein
VERPNFSLPVMSSNFRRFNARIGVAFVLQNRLIRLFTWRVPTQTLSFLAVYTFVCLDPYLLPALPLAMCLFFIMVPAFLARHPPPPSYHPTDLYPLQGAPVAPARYIKPAPELSKDFFRNMRDLQNSMEDFSRVHDATIAIIGPVTNFSNEALSSTVFLLLTFVTCGLFIASSHLPWRALFLGAGWFLTSLGHPTVQGLLHDEKADDIISTHEKEATSRFQRFAADDSILSVDPETREVEIFELQHRQMHIPDSEFEPYVFSPSPYTPLSPSRIAGDRPHGARFFEDVQPPQGWEWKDKKWSLDLLSREWVEERCITGVEVEIEYERWVMDIDYEENASEELMNVFGTSPKKTSKQDGKSKDKEPVRTWEEGTGNGKRGEWRRRRWTRVVQRKRVDTESDYVVSSPT